MVGLGGDLQKRLRSRRLSEQLGSEARLLRQQMMELLRRKMMDLAREIEEADISRFSRERMYQQLGDLLKNMGQGKEALRQYEEGYKLAQKVAEEKPDSDFARANLGIMLMRLGDIALEMNGDARTARQYYQKGWELQHEVATHPRGSDFPVEKKWIVRSHHDIHLGRACLHLGHISEALKHFQEALKIRQEWAASVSHSAEARSYLAEVHMWLGTTAWHRGDAKVCTQSFHDALEFAERLLKTNPNFVGFKADLAEVYAAWGEAQVHLGRDEEAKISFEKSLANVNIVLAHDPDDPSQQPLLARLHEGLGGRAQRRGQAGEADKHYQEALTIREDLASLEPENLMGQAAHALALARCGKLREASRRADGLRPQAAQSPDLLLHLARCHAVCAAAIQQKQAHFQAALEALQALAALDYRDAVLLRTDPDLASLRDQSAFRALVSKME